MSHLAAGDLFEESVHVADVVAQQVVCFEHVIDTKAPFVIAGERGTRGDERRGVDPLRDDDPEPLGPTGLAGAPDEPVVLALADERDGIPTIHGAAVRAPYRPEHSVKPLVHTHP